MASYLDAYGALEQKRAKRARLMKIAVIAGAFAIAGAILLYAIFKNHAEEVRVKDFLAELRAAHYQEAYARFGCTPAAPCRDYSFQKFLEDWGPQSGHPANAARIGLSQSCGTGVILQVNYRNSESVSLWVERGSKVISFAPWPECPGRHWHFGSFLRSLFNR